MTYNFGFFKGEFGIKEEISSILTFNCSISYSKSVNGIEDGGVIKNLNSTVEPPLFPAKGIKEYVSLISNLYLIGILNKFTLIFEKGYKILL